MNRAGLSGQALALVLIGATLAGCGALTPYPTAPQDASSGGAPGHRVAICYNPAESTVAAVRAAAQQECAADNLHNTTAEPAGTDWYLQHCPLLLPTRATFVCKPATKPATK